MYNEYNGTGYYIAYNILKKEISKMKGKNLVCREKLQISRDNRYGMEKTHNEIQYNNTIERNNQSINEIEEILKIIEDKIDLLNN